MRIVLIAAVLPLVAAAGYRTDVQMRVRALDGQMPAIVAAAEGARRHIDAHPNAGLEVSRMECCATHYELAGRAGGLAQVGDVSTRPDGVVLWTVRSWEDFGARAVYLADGWRRMGKFLIVVASAAGRPADFACDHFIDNGAPDGSAAQGRVNVLVNTAIAWTWVCEYAAAFSREGRFPAIYRSVATADAFGVIARNRSPDLAHRFHPCATPIPPGRLGGVYLNSLDKRLVDLGECVVQEGLARAADVIADHLAKGGRVGAVGIGHLIMDEVRTPTAPIFGFRWYTIPEALFDALDEGDLLVYYGYSGMGGESWNYMKPIREGKLGLVASYAPEPQSAAAENPLALIPQMWKLPDAEVAMPVPPYTMGTQSEFDRIVIQRELESAVNARLAEKGAKPQTPRAAHPDSFNDKVYCRGWPYMDSTFFAEKAPDPGDRWGRLDAAGRPVGEPAPRDPFVAQPVEDSFCGYRRFAADGDVTLVSENGKWGVVDREGRLSVPVKYDSLQRLSERLFAADLGGKFGVVDSTDKVVTPFVYDMIDKVRGTGRFLPDGSFRFGSIDNETGRETEPPNRGWYRKTPLKMRDREARREPKIDVACDYVADEEGGVYRVARNGRWGLVDKAGKVLLPLDYTYVQPADGAGFHYVAKGGEWRQDVSREGPAVFGAKWGAVGLDGRILVEPKYDGLVRDGDGWRYVLRRRLTRQTP